MINNESPILLNQPSADPTGLPEQPFARAPDQSPEQKVLNLVKALLTWFLSVVLLIVGSLILAVPYMIYVAATQATDAQSLVQDKTVIFLSILGVIPLHLLTVVAVWAIYTNWGKIPFWKTLNFTWPKGVSPSQTVLYCAVLSLLLLGIGMVINYFIGGPKTDIDKLIESSTQARLATVFLAVLTAPLVEELIYRGTLYPAWEKIAGPGVAIAIVAIMFTGVHVYQYWPNVGVISVIALLSVVLTTVRAFSKSLLPPFLIHLFFNGIQALMLLIEPFVTKPEATPPAPVPALIQVWLTLRHLF